MIIRKKSFTLAELLLVVAIIGILASVVIVSLASARERSRDARRLADMDTIKTSVDLYYDNNGVYPSSNQWSYSFDVATGLDNPNWIPSSTPALIPQYLPNLPLDPLNDATHRYGYITDAAATEYKIKITNLEASGNKTKAVNDGGNDNNALEFFSPGGRGL